MQSRPFVFVNMAMTADGKIDTVARQGARISGPADNARVDRLRAASDAIMVGGHTLLSEDPRLTVREPALVRQRVSEGRPAQPMKVGVATRLAPSGRAALDPAGAFLNEGGGRVLIFTTSQTDEQTIAKLEGAGARVAVAGSERVDLRTAVSSLTDLGVGRLMVEGGSTLAAALLEGALVDELQLAVAPLLFGGSTAPTPVGGDGWPREGAIALQLLETERSQDGDVILRYRVGTGTGR